MMTSPAISRFAIPEFSALPEDIQTRITGFRKKQDLFQMSLWRLPIARTSFVPLWPIMMRLFCAPLA